MEISSRGSRGVKIYGAATFQLGLLLFVLNMYVCLCFVVNNVTWHHMGKCIHPASYIVRFAKSTSRDGTVALHSMGPTTFPYFLSGRKWQFELQVTENNLK